MLGSLTALIVEVTAKRLLQRWNMEQKLNENGHLHVKLEDETEFGLSKHDVEVEGGTVIVDSKRGYWEFDVDDILYIDVEPSGPVDH